LSQSPRRRSSPLAPPPVYYPSIADPQPTNDLPNPYQSIAPWGNLPEGRKWGALNGVAIDNDGESVWMGMDMWAFPMEMNASGASGALVTMQGVPSGGNSTLVYFGCEDCAVEEGRVTKSGGSIHKNKFAIGQYGFISLVTDTEGNMFGLHSMK